MNELLSLKSVKKYFRVRGKELLKAVDDVSIAVNKGEVFGLVGESGCGKSTLARLAIKLLPADSGEMYFEGIDIARARGDDLTRLRQGMQIIFQDPLSALNPRKRIIDTIGEALIINRMRKRGELADHVVQLLRKVGLDSDSLYKYPHEFSGGQRQRICIGRALAVNPRLVIADEPLSALDVSIQAQILNLLKELQKHDGLAFVFITHNLHVIENFSDLVAVMYLGKIVERSVTTLLFQEPLHPYTEALLSVVPKPEITVETKRIVPEGDVPSPVSIPGGCPYHPRCHRRFKPCDHIVPDFREARPGRWVSCHLWQ